MKKIYSTIMLLTMMVAALGFTACGGDDDDDINGGGNSSKGEMTLTIDGESYYATNCSAEQTRGRGMYLNIRASTSSQFSTKGKELVVHISPSRVSELSVGDVFDSGSMSIQMYHNFNEVVINTYTWRAIEGNITIKKITNMEMTIQINDLVLKHKEKDIKRTISGTAVLNSATYDSQGNLLSFDEAID